MAAFPTEGPCLTAFDELSISAIIKVKSKQGRMDNIHDAKKVQLVKLSITVTTQQTKTVHSLSA